MNYRAKRLSSEDGAPTGYQLFSDAEKLLLVADLTTPPDDAPGREVRFVRPDGTLLATMGMTACVIGPVTGCKRQYQQRA